MKKLLLLVLVSLNAGQAGDALTLPHPKIIKMSSHLSAVSSFDLDGDGY